MANRTITRLDIVDALKREVGISRADSVLILEEVLDEITACLIFVPFGHYDEPEILPYAIRLICPISADVRQATTITIKRGGKLGV